MLTSFSIYGIVMIATPQSYKIETNQKFSKSFMDLAEKLETISIEEAEKYIIDFCIEYRAAAELEGGQQKKAYGTFIESQQSSAQDLGMTMGSKTTIQFAGSNEYYTLTAMPMDIVENEMMTVFLQLFPWIIVLIILISILGSYICSRILAKPVLKISRISKRMSELDMTWHCDINRIDEIGILANSLNVMAQKLNMTMTELETANQQLQLDIEREKSQEKQRRAFFAAVSHELKTPITILKGQIESMIYQIGDYKNKDKYLPLFLETVERMENMVKEILTISRLTADGFQLQKTPIDLKNLVQEYLHVYKLLLEQKNIELDISQLESVTMEVDRKLFEKVISNVISNAAIYTPEGGKILIVLNNNLFSIINMGTYIPDEKLSELFAPLTRVEESRNKHTGGSGLGLYIVKTVLDLHELPCLIKNVEEGVEFSITFI